jgi:hypothetical protein
VSVAFTASSPATGGPVQKYTAISSPGSISASASTSPVVVTGLTNSTAYTFTVAAGNATGNGVFSSASASATPAVATSFESISTVALSSSNGTITFSSIPSTYKHLQIRMFAASTNGTVADAYIRFNNDSTATYFCHQMRGGGSGTAQGFSYTTQNQMVITSNTGQSSTGFSAAVCDVLDYQNTNKNKTIRSLNGYDLNGSGEAIFWSGAWNSTAAITRIDITLSGGTFYANSHFALYGIKG